MLNRRAFLYLGAAAAALFATHAPASAQSEDATTFVHDFGMRLINVVNGDATLAE